MQLCMEVERRLQTMEEEIVVNPQYVQKVLGPQDDEGPAPSSAQSSSSSSSTFNIVSSMWLIFSIPLSLPRILWLVLKLYIIISKPCYACLYFLPSAWCHVCFGQLLPPYFFILCRHIVFVFLFHSFFLILIHHAIYKKFKEKFVLGRWVSQTEVKKNDNGYMPTFWVSHFSLKRNSSVMHTVCW